MIEKMWSLKDKHKGVPFKNDLKEIEDRQEAKTQRAKRVKVGRKIKNLNK